MATFAEHVVVMRDFTAVTFKPGDELPDWAVGLVGDHCLVPEVAEESGAEPDFTGSTTPDASEEHAPAPEEKDEDEKSEESDEKDAEDDESESQIKDETPDFTAPAPRRGRPRKNA
ncbi:hypothetical protein SAMN04487917_101345 [Arthrobacter sp. yr096]|uniref:hypothetical protein n=1 Tax=Arthrobacter sp. yr096 TaxID=1761750 RepID=UPI0008AFDC87|nr:hypothetical protein [Arthrobacter sp. yr096]SEI44796.1 hypothetical protein SAMN04487917_101345 [Arthrobacter sp. yr096]